MLDAGIDFNYQHLSEMQNIQILTFIKMLLEWDAVTFSHFSLNEAPN